GLIIWMLRCGAIAQWRPQNWLTRPQWAEFRTLGKLSLPTSIQVVCEVGAFNAAMLIIGRMGAQAMAAHQVVIACAGIAFMVPLGLSQATTVRIGEAWGAKQYHRLRPIMYGSYAVGMGLFWFVALIFLLFNHEIAEVFLP